MNIIIIKCDILGEVENIYWMYEDNWIYNWITYS